jgi:hypothetical protein
VAPLYGSTDNDFGNGIAVDSSGNVYVTGYNFQSWGSPLNPHAGGWDMVIVKLDSDGAYQWHTFYGSTDNDFGNGIAVDSSGNVYVTGESYDSWGSPLNSHAGSGYTDLAIVKLDSAGVYQWHTFYGSTSSDYGSDIAVDNSGNVYVTGESFVTWGSPLNPHAGNGFSDIVIVKLNSSGAYQWHTFYGSISYDNGRGIAVDSSGNAYVAGWSSNTWGSPLNAHASDGYYDIVIIKCGDGVLPPTAPTRVGVHRDNTFYLDADGDLNFDAASDRFSNFGTPADIPVIGNWNGDGYDQIGIRRDNTFYLDYNDNMAWEYPGDIFGNFGVATDTVLIGDWTDDGYDQVGVWRDGTFFLDYDGNLDFDPAVDKMYSFGAADGTPIIGDWNGDGKDQIGVRSGSTFYLDYDGDGAWNPAVDKMGSFGLATDKIIIGDWNGDGSEQIGVHRDNTFYLDYDGNLNFDAATDKFANFGTPDDIPVIGDWTGDGSDQIGIRRGPTYYLDFNGNMAWEYPGDIFGNYGIDTDKILLGKWKEKQAPAVESINVDDFDPNWIMFYLIDENGGFYDGTLPGAVTLVEGDGGLTDDSRVRASSIVWDPNIDASGYAKITYNGLEFNHLGGAGGTYPVRFPIRTSDNFVTLYITVTLTYSGGTAGWQTATITNVE